MGVHVLDVLVRPVEAIPEGQGGELVEEIRITAAGSAGGTALVLAKLGARVQSAGAIGRDAAGDMLLALLERDGVDTVAARAPRRRADLRQRAADPPERRAAGLPRGRRQRHLRPRRRAARRDRGGHPPAPRRPGVHGRRGGRADPRARARARRGHLRRRARARRARPARLDRAGARRSSTTCCRTASRCSR